MVSRISKAIIATVIVIGVIVVGCYKAYKAEKQRTQLPPIGKVVDVKEIQGYSKYCKVAKQVLKENEDINIEELHQLQYVAIMEAAQEDGKYISSYYIDSILKEVNEDVKE